MAMAKRLLLMIPLVLACVGCDHLTKAAAREHLAASAGHSFFGDLLHLQYAENPGAFLSLGIGLSDEARFWVFTVAVGTILLGTAGVALKSRALRPAAVAALALILGGGLGNLVDRITNDGRVVDFLNLGVGPVRTGVFNLADVAITAGVTLLFFSEFFRRGPKQPLAPGGSP